MAGRIIEKIALAVIEDRKLLLVKTFKHRDRYLLLGGKIETGETDLDCLNREVGEELNSKIDQNSIKFLQEFTAPAHGKTGVTLHVKLFSGKLLTAPAASAEVESYGYYDSSIEEKYLTGMTRKVIDYLVAEKLID